MSATPLSRRSLAAVAGAWMASRSLPAAAAPAANAFETDVWTGSVLMDQGGSSFVLAELRRPLTLLKLWAGWCPACATELPQLATMAAAMKQEVEVILVSHPQYWAADQVAARRRGVPFRLATFAPSNPGAMVQQALLGQGGTFAVPRSLVFRERDRSIVLKQEGATDWAAGPVVSRLQRLA